ncbi:MAG: MAPEG family protein [Erythrobacter sp.]
MGIILPVTLTAAAAAAIINIWLSMRVGQLRQATRTVHGDDGGGPLTRRMRAQLNFVENTPFVLVLIAAIELSGRGNPWLAWVAGIYMLGRVAHGFGMDGETATKPRMIGVIISMLTLLGLAIVATLIAMGVM